MKYFVLLLLCISFAFALPLSPPQVGLSDFEIELVFNAPVQVTNVDLLFLSNVVQSSLPVSGTGTTWTLSVGGLQPGDYTLRVSKTDPLNPALTLPDDIVQFEYNPSIAGFDLQIDSPNRLRASGGVPETWFSKSSPYNIPFISNQPAYCKYSTNGQSNSNQMVDFDTTGTATSLVSSHSLTQKSWSEINPLIAWCQGPQNSLTKQFIIGYETIAPKFNVSLNPLIVVDPTNKKVNFSIIPQNQGAPQKVYCEAVDNIGQTVGFSPPFVKNQAAAYRTRPSASITVGGSYAQATNIPYDVTCTNRAGLFSTQRVNVQVNLQTNGSIILVSPKQFTNKLSPQIKIQVQKSGVPIQVQSCSFTDGTTAQFTSTNGINFTTSLSSLSQGTHTFTVQCVLADATQINGQIALTIDLLPPPTPTRVIPAFLCGIQPLYAEMTLPANAVPDPNFLGYNWTIGYSPYKTGDRILAAGLSTQDRIVANFSQIVQDSTFDWHIKAIDKAGNVGSDIGGTSRIVAPNDPRCDTTPPQITVDVEPGAARNFVSVSCEDDLSECTDTFQYGFFPNVNIAECSYNKVESYIRGGQPTSIPFYTQGTFCYRGLDKAGNEYKGRVELQIADVSKPTLVIYEPKNIVTTTSVKVLVGVESAAIALPVASCTFTDGPLASFTSTDGVKFSTSISIPDGEQTRGIACTLLTGSVVEGVVSFIKDTTAPANHLLDVPEFVCEGSPLSAIASHDYRYPLDPRFAGYHYSLSYDVIGGAVLSSENSVNGLLTYSSSSITAGNSYRWSVYAYDSVGNNATAIVKSTAVVATSDPRCDITKPTVKVIESPQQLGVGVSLNCTDSGSGCTQYYYFDFLAGESNPVACSFSQQRRYDAGPLTVIEDGLFCYRAADKQFNTVQANKQINVGTTNAKLEIMSPNSTYVRTQNVPFSVRVLVDNTPIQSQSCSFVDGASGTWPQASKLDHSTTANFPEGGVNKVTIACAVGGIFVSNTVNFTVDSQLPKNHILTAPLNRCSDQVLVATASHDDDYPFDPTFTSYEWQLSIDVAGGAVLASGLSSDGQLAGPRGEVGKKYRWSVIPVDRAGNKGSQIVKSTTVLAPGSLQCDYTAPVGNAIVSETPQGIIVSVSCIDDVKCRSTFAYDLLPVGTTQNACTYSQSAPLTDSLKFFESGTFCYKVFDENGNTAQNSKKINMPSISDPYIAVHSPGAYANTAAIPVTISVQVQGHDFVSENCTFTDGATAKFSSTDGVRYTASLSGLNDDSHSRQVECTLAGGRKVAGVVTFTKDTQPPKNYNLYTPAFVCENVPLRVDTTHDDKFFPDKNFAGFEYLLTFDLPGASFENTDQSVREFARGVSADGFITYDGSDIGAGNKYKWQVRPYDFANNKGTVMSGVTEMVSASDSRCDAIAPNASVIVFPSTLGYSVTVNCTDSGSGCTPAFSYDFLPGQTDSSSCTYEKQRRYDAGPISIFEQGLLCYRVSDQQLNTAIGSKQIEGSNVSVTLEILEPNEWATKNQVSFKAQARVSDIAYPADSCSFIDGANGTFTKSGAVFSATAQFIDGGPYSVDIGCFVAGSPIVDTVSFSVDSIAPQNHKLTVPPVLCEGQELVAKASHDSKFTQDINFEGYEYSLGYDTGTVVLDTGLSPDGEMSFGKGKIGEIYKWTVVAKDKAGNKGGVLTGTTQVVAANDPDCDLEAPVGTAKITTKDDAVIVSVSCIDNKGKCSETFSYDVLPAGSSEASCTYTKSALLGEDLKFFEDGLFCFKVFDLSLNEGTGSASLVSIGTPIPTPLECSNDILDEDIGETDVDCGGPCSACSTGDQCLSNQDCSSDFCDDTFECGASSCTDGKKNGYETDVDCGGLNCGSCFAGTQCSVDADCAGGFCEAGECIDNLFPVPTDTDGDGMPDEWELDNGLDPNDPSDAVEDPDNDGRSNYEEYKDHTDPNKFDQPRDTLQQPLDAGFNWLALILILSGIMIMGGSSYWLYYEHEEKESQARRRRYEAQQQSSRPRLAPSPAQRQNMAAQRQTQMNVLRSQREVPLRTRPVQKTPISNNSEIPASKDKPGDEYIHIDDLKGKKKKESEAFKDLDKLLREQDK